MLPRPAYNLERTITENHQHQYRENPKCPTNGSTGQREKAPAEPVCLTTLNKKNRESVTDEFITGGSIVKSLISVLCISIMFIITFSWVQTGCNVRTACAATDQRGLVVRPKAPTGEEVKGEQWVLTIGIDSYLSWPRLKTATNDAKALKKVLLERYHVDSSRIIELYDENATRKNILGTLRDLSRKVKPDDSLLIFYAGHGHVDNITKKGSWIPVESSTEDPSAWISNQDIKDYLNIDAIKAKHVLLVSDSCFSGDFFRGSRGAIPEVTDVVVKKAYQLSSRQAITSGGLEPVSDAGFGGNSVFSHFLVAALQNNTKPYLIPSELFPTIKSGVAQNAEQFPQMGSLYGVGGQEGGELVLFLKPENKLESLSAGSAVRQKELEQLRKAEAADAAAKQREQAEIAKRQAELDALDRQIIEMKGRLGSGSARSTDGLDQIIAMAEKKEEQGKRLEDLRRQREAEERTRQEEIEQLKREAKTKKAAQVQADLAKYEKVASSKYAQDMKGAAWGAMVANYPEAKDVAEGDVDQFVAQFGFVRDGYTIMNREDKISRDEEKRKLAYKQEQERKATENEPFDKFLKGNWKFADGNTIYYFADGYAVLTSLSNNAQRNGFREGEVGFRNIRYKGNNKFECQYQHARNGERRWQNANLTPINNYINVDYLEPNPFTGKENRRDKLIRQ
jgi:hypothetical protein